MDVGVHALDAIDFIAGPLRGASGLCRRAGPLPPGCGVESSVALVAQAGSALVTASWCFASMAPREDRFVFTGTAGRLAFSCFGTEPLELTTADGTTEHFSFDPLDHVQQPMVQSIVDELRGVSTAPAASRGDNAIRVADTVASAIRP